MISLSEQSHSRLNILTGERVLVSPHRMKRPWQGKTETVAAAARPVYMPGCYLCPGNTRNEGATNPDYTGPYSFVNDYAALQPDYAADGYEVDDILQARAEGGICKVICFSPRHDLTLPLLSLPEIESVIQKWQEEFTELSAEPAIRYIQIFENKGEIMGCSNPHPHGQIWATTSVPLELEKESRQQQLYYKRTGKSLLGTYLQTEKRLGERIVLENDHFMVLVPFWAVWPYETLIISKRQVQYITEFTPAEKTALAGALKILTTRYDNLFHVSFPYSAGIHQAPVNGPACPEWHWHMHFYPPLLRSATVKKFMVGYEMLATPQRDITAEAAARQLRELPDLHYTQAKGA